MERSIGAGTTRVHTSLNRLRAMTLCCTANSASSARSMTSATAQCEYGPPKSMLLGTRYRSPASLRCVFSTNPTGVEERADEEHVDHDAVQEIEDAGHARSRV